MIKRFREQTIFDKFKCKMGDSAFELEYHLQFPVPTVSNFASHEKDDLPFIYDGEKLPVVILFGWTGCKDRYLAKYSAIYEDKRCITLRCTPPVIMTFLRHDKLRKLGEKLLNVLQERCLDEHPIFFHVFSNGGAFFYQNVSSLLEKKKLDLEVKGVIFDSAPGQRRFLSIFKTFTTIIGGDSWYKIPVAFLITVFLFTAFFILSLLKGLLELRKPQTDPINLINEPFMWPQMFIYSKDDELVKFQDVEKFAAVRSSQGVPVRSLCFSSSPHVQHLMKHRTVYSNAIVNFLKDCLENSRALK